MHSNKTDDTSSGKEVDLQACQHMDIGSLRTVCLLLGPYRNLTTLTASVLFLHPDCQVLNHAGCRIFFDERVDFLTHHSYSTLETFLKFALYISKSGRRGDYGGSILHSHAFDQQHLVRELFNSSKHLVTDRPAECLVWKESQRISNHLRNNSVDIDTLLERFPSLRFMMPIRNPLDCAVSNLRTGHYKTLRGVSPTPTIESVVDAVIREFAWVYTIKQRHVMKCFLFSQDALERSFLVSMLAFLRLRPCEQWISDAMRAFALKRNYCHHPDLISYCHERITATFPQRNPFSDTLRRLIDCPM